MFLTSALNDALKKSIETLELQWLCVSEAADAISYTDEVIATQGTML